jgi:hypothetical protein
VAEIIFAAERNVVPVIQPGSPGPRHEPGWIHARYPPLPPLLGQLPRQLPAPRRHRRVHPPGSPAAPATAGTAVAGEVAAALTNVWPSRPAHRFQAQPVPGNSLFQLLRPGPLVPGRSKILGREREGFPVGGADLRFSAAGMITWLRARDQEPVGDRSQG